MEVATTTEPRFSICPTRYAVQMGVLILALLVLYTASIMDLLNTLWSDVRISFGLLVPLISGYFVWVKRAELRRLPIVPSGLAGFLTIGTACFLLVVGRIGGIIRLEWISLILLIIGLVLGLLGKDFLKAVLFPIIYLLFMVPIFEHPFAPINRQFQLLTSNMGVLILQTLGFPATVDQQYVVFPNIILEVAQDCNGVRYLFSIIVLGIPLSYLNCKGWRARVVLILMAVSIGIIANWLRIVFIGIEAYYSGKVTLGPLHVFHGVFVAWIGYCTLIFGAHFVSKAEVRINEPSPNIHLSQAKPAAWSFPKDWNRSCTPILGLLLACITYLSVYDRNTVLPKQNLSGFPSTIENWEEYQDDRQWPILRVEGADHELFKRFQNKDGRQLYLYVAYLESQRQEKEVVNDKMARFHKDAQKIKIDAGPSGTVLVNQTAVEINSKPYGVIFWYDLNGRVISDRVEAKLWTIWDAATSGKTNGALVMIQYDIENIGSAKSENDLEKSFARDCLPILREYLP